MEKLKELAWAFLIGGSLCLVGQVLLVLVCFTPLYERGLHALAALLLLGIFGGVLFLADIYPKLEKKGGMGAVMPFSGLMVSVASMFCEAAQETGSKSKAAGIVLSQLMGKVILLAMVIAVMLSTVYYFSGLLGSLAAPYAPGGINVALVGPPNGTEAGPPAGIPVSINGMGFVWAFIIGGALAALFQIAVSLFKLPVPIFLVLAFSLGAALVPTGIMKALVQLSGAGTLVYIFDCGEATVATFSAFLQGNFLPFLSLIALFAVVYAVGICFALIKISLGSKKSKLEHK